MLGALTADGRNKMGGVTVGISGSGCTLFSENPDHFYRSFDAIGVGSSDVDAYLYFDNDSDASLREVFWGSKQKKGAFTGFNRGRKTKLGQTDMKAEIVM